MPDGKCEQCKKYPTECVFIQGRLKGFQVPLCRDCFQRWLQEVEDAPALD